MTTVNNVDERELTDMELESVAGGIGAGLAAVVGATVRLCVNHDVPECRA
jgi:hypothetical protein